MPSHPTRRGLLALLTVVFLFTAIVPPVFARNPYQLSDGCEGDPGDGVLNPSMTSGSKTVSFGTVDSADAVAWWRLPAVILPAGLSSTPLLIVVPLDWWRTAVTRQPAQASVPTGGRWHHAR